MLLTLEKDGHDVAQVEIAYRPTVPAGYDQEIAQRIHNTRLTRVINLGGGQYLGVPPSSQLAYYFVRSLDGDEQELARLLRFISYCSEPDTIRPDLRVRP